jgi:hypothetical protein
MGDEAVVHRGDLHLHSMASDGTESVRQLARRARDAGLSCIAVTDHDAIPSELSSARMRLEGVDVLSGVEIKVDIAGVRGELLGIGVDPGHRRLKKLLRGRQAERRERLDAMWARCRQRFAERLEGVTLAPPSAAVSVGRPHLAQRLVERGIVATRTEAFERYIGRGKPCYASLSHPY